MKNISLYLGDKSTSLRVDELQSFSYASYGKNLPSPFNTLTTCLLLKQTHAVEGRVFTDYHDAVSYVPASCEGDYLITSLKRVGLAVATADCLPIVLYDACQEVAALIHAGWRGSCAGITEKVVNHLARDFGTRANDIQVIFGPSAGVCCYEVDKNFPAPVQERAGCYYFDNKLFTIRALERAGVTVAPQDTPCTICDTRFCSYRREGKEAGRQLTIIALV